jgi:hypothetical protein
MKGGGRAAEGDTGKGDHNAMSALTYPAVRGSASPPLAPLGWIRGSAPRLRRGPRRGGGALRASAHRTSPGGMEP